MMQHPWMVVTINVAIMLQGVVPENNSNMKRRSDRGF